MSLKKYLKRYGNGLTNCGQVIMEYFILMVVILALTLVGRSTFFSGFRGNMDRFNRATLTKIQTNAGDEIEESPLDPPDLVADEYDRIHFHTPQYLADSGGDAYWGEGDDGRPVEPGDSGTGPGGPGDDGPSFPL